VKDDKQLFNCVFCNSFILYILFINWCY